MKAPHQEEVELSGPAAGPLDQPKFRWVLAVWLSLGATDALQGYTRNSASGESFDALETLLGPMPAYAMLAVLTPVVFRVAARFPISTRDKLGFAVHVLAAAAFPIVHLISSAALTAIVFRIAGRTNVGAQPLIADWLGAFYAADVLRYWAVVGVYHAIANHKRAHRNAIEAGRARFEAAVHNAAANDARLQLLMSQLHPHFLFNALNVIDGLVLTGDNRRASAVIFELARTLRTSLSLPAITTTLRMELELVQSYLSIERARLGDRLTVDVDIPTELLSAQVPTFVLQLLVENAVRHGVGAVPGPGRVTIRARASETCLSLEVRDSGAGISPTGDTRGVGIGLRNIRSRLEQLYGDDARLELTAPPAGGVSVVVECPLVVAPAEVP